MDNRILFLQKCLWHSSPHFVGIALFDWLSGQDKKLILEKKVCFSRTISRLKVTYMFMTLATSFFVLFNCYATDKIFTAVLLVFHCCCYTWAIVR